MRLLLEIILAAALIGLALGEIIQGPAERSALDQRQNHRFGKINEARSKYSPASGPQSDRRVDMGS